MAFMWTDTTGSERKSETASLLPIYDEALALAHAIETLLGKAQTRAKGQDGFHLRLAEAMNRSLIDQLDELRRGHESASS